jgi:hypothetical protein
MADGANPMAVGGEVGGAAGDVIGSLIGEALARGDYEEAERLRKQALGQYDNIGLPGDMAQLGPSAYENVAPDQQSRQARRDILSRMMQVGFEGGMDPESKAALAQAEQQSAGYEQQQRGAILDANARRGMLSTGANVAAQMQAAQSGANRVAMAGTQAAADARKRALMAMQMSGDMAGGLERDDYGQKANLADRRDAIAEFNAKNRQDFSQQRFGNQMKLADAKYGAYRDGADDSEEKGDKTVQKARGYGRAVGSAGGTAAGAGFL